MLLTGCTKPADEKNDAQPENQMDNTQPADTTEDTHNELSENDSDDASLVSLRQAMTETPQVFAAAFFGYVGQGEDPLALMKDYAPAFCEDLTFLMTVGDENIIGDIGYLFCIVPGMRQRSVDRRSE